MRKALVAGLTVAIIAAVGFALTLAVCARECPTEDSTMCTWYVDSGNGQGASFTDFGFGVVYWSK